MKVKIGHGIVFWIDAKDYTIFEDFIWEEWGQQITAPSSIQIFILISSNNSPYSTNCI